MFGAWGANNANNATNNPAQGTTGGFGATNAFGQPAQNTGKYSLDASRIMLTCIYHLQNTTRRVWCIRSASSQPSTTSNWLWYDASQ